MAVRRGAPARLGAVAIVVLCAFGAAIRLPGLTSRDLWFDDAWAALPAHVGLADALRMVVTTPLYTLGLRSWLEVGPGDTWWAQLPALVLGVAGIAAVYALVRAHGLPRVGALVAACVVAAGPVTVTYSTRVKEYPADLLLTCLVLWLVERWRTAPSTRGLVLLALASVGAIWISASTAAVVGGAAAVVVLVAWTRRDLRAHAVGLVGLLAVAAGALWLVVLRHLPGQLRANWRTHGFLFGYSGLHHVGFAFEQTFSGLAHGLVGLPIPYAFDTYPIRAVAMGLAVATVVVLAALVVPPLVGAARGRGVPGPTVAAALAVVLAVAGTLAGVAPLGDGRTDESLYPALLLLAVALATSLVRRRALAWTAHKVARGILVGAVGAATLWFGIAHVAAYPPTGLRAAWASLEPKLRPGDVVVVDGYESFTWADEDLGPWAVSFRQGAVPWPMGFHAVSRDGAIALSSEYLQPDASILTLHDRTHRVWIVGPTVGGYSTSAPSELWDVPFCTPTLAAFAGCYPYAGANGWRPATPVPVSSSGVYSWLFVYR